MVEAVRGYTLYGEDDRRVVVTESRDKATVTVECPDGAVTLDYDTYHALFELRYQLEIKQPVPFEPSRGESVQIDPLPPMQGLAPAHLTDGQEVEVPF